MYLLLSAHFIGGRQVVKTNQPQTIIVLSAYLFLRIDHHEVDHSTLFLTAWKTFQATCLKSLSVEI